MPATRTARAPEPPPATARTQSDWPQRSEFSRRASTAWATKTRLERIRVISAANKAAGRTVVSSLRILPPGAVPAPDQANVAPADPASTAPTGPAKTRETACEGYRHALEAHRRAAPSSRVNPGIAEAVEWQTSAMRELSRRAFPELDVVPDDVPAQIEQSRVQRRRQAAAPRPPRCAGPAPNALGQPRPRHPLGRRLGGPKEPTRCHRPPGCSPSQPGDGAPVTSPT